MFQPPCIDSLDRNRFYELLISICWLFLWNIIFINPTLTKSCQESLLWISQYFVLKYTIFQYFFPNISYPYTPFKGLVQLQCAVTLKRWPLLWFHMESSSCAWQKILRSLVPSGTHKLLRFSGDKIFPPRTSHWELILLYVCYRKPQISPMLLLNRETVCPGLLLRSLFALMRQSMLSLWFTSHISVAQ